VKRNQTSWTDDFALSKAKPGKDGRQVAICQQGLIKMLLLKTVGARTALLFGCSRHTASKTLSLLLNYTLKTSLS